MGGVLSWMVFKKGTNTIKTDVATSFFDLKAKDINGHIIDFNIFRDRKAMMVVNVACK
jgi:hypothetical protein